MRDIDWWVVIRNVMIVICYILCIFMYAYYTKDHTSLMRTCVFSLSMYYLASVKLTKKMRKSDKWTSFKNEIPPLDRWIKVCHFGEVFEGKAYITNYDQIGIIWKSGVRDGFISSYATWTLVNPVEKKK